MSTLRNLHDTEHGKPLCRICSKPVKLEAAKTDDEGHAVHEDCYLDKIQGKIPPSLRRKTDA